MNLSIIVPVYNGGKFLKKCIENVLEQTYKDLEVIIVNDGSTDDTKAICDGYDISDKRVRFIHIENSGVSTARNIGVEAARGKYIGFLDCDDRIDNKMYSSMIRILEKESVDMVMCSYVSEFDDHNEEKLFDIANIKVEDKSIKNEIMLKMVSSINENGSYNEVIMGSIWRCLYKKEIIESNYIKFDKELKYSEDLVFVLEYLDACKSVYLTNDIYYFYNRKTADLSTTQKHIVGLEGNIDKVHKRLLEILDIPNFKSEKSWALREITNMYTISVNIAIQNDKTFSEKVKELRRMLKRREFDLYIKKLNSNEYYSLNKLVVLSLKYKLYFLVIKYYSKKWGESR